MDTEAVSAPASHATSYANSPDKRFDEWVYSDALNRDKVPVVYTKDPNEPVTSMNPFQAPMVYAENIRIPFGVSTKYAKPGDMKYTVPITLSEPLLRNFIASDDAFLAYVSSDEMQRKFFPGTEPLSVEDFIKHRFRPLIQRTNPKYPPGAKVKIVVDPSHKDFVEVRLGKYDEAGNFSHAAMDWKSIPAGISPRDVIVELLKPKRGREYDIILKQNGGHKAPDKLVGQSYVIRSVIIKESRTESSDVHYQGHAAAKPVDVNQFGIDVTKMAAAASGGAPAMHAGMYGAGAVPGGFHGTYGGPMMGGQPGSHPGGQPGHYAQQPMMNGGAPPMGGRPAVPGGFDPSAFGYPPQQ